MTAILSRDEILRIPPEVHTLAGFRAWALSEDVPEKLPVSFLSGQVLIDMSKEEIATHALVKTEVGRVLGNLNEERVLGHLKNGWTRSKTLGRECKLTRKRDRSGTWKYSLALRADA